MNINVFNYMEKIQILLYIILSKKCVISNFDDCLLVTNRNMPCRRPLYCFCRFCEHIKFGYWSTANTSNKLSQAIRKHVFATKGNPFNMLTVKK